VPDRSLFEFAVRHSPRARVHARADSRSFSTVREFFAAKLRNPAQRHADAPASGIL